MGARACCNDAPSLRESLLFGHVCSPTRPSCVHTSGTTSTRSDILTFELQQLPIPEYFVSVRHPRPQEVRHPHRENPTPIPHRWCMAAARIAHGRHAVGSFRNCVQPSHGLAFNGQYMRVVNDTVADGIGHGRIIKQLMPAGDVELRTEDSGCHLTPGFN